MVLGVRQPSIMRRTAYGDFVNVSLFSFGKKATETMFSLFCLEAVGVCDFLWNEYNSNCYIHQYNQIGPVDYDTAEINCKKLSSKLAVIKDSKIQAFINKLCKITLEIEQEHIEFT
jgi:hypothetical protein